MQSPFPLNQATPHWLNLQEGMLPLMNVIIDHLARARCAPKLQWFSMPCHAMSQPGPQSPPEGVCLRPTPTPRVRPVVSADGKQEKRHCTKKPERWPHQAAGQPPQCSVAGKAPWYAGYDVLSQVGQFSCGILELEVEQLRLVWFPSLPEPIQPIHHVTCVFKSSKQPRRCLLLDLVELASHSPNFVVNPVSCLCGVNMREPETSVALDNNGKWGGHMGAHQLAHQALPRPQTNPTHPVPVRAPFPPPPARQLRQLGWNHSAMACSFCAASISKSLILAVCWASWSCQQSCHHIQHSCSARFA